MDVALHGQQYPCISRASRNKGSLVFFSCTPLENRKWTSTGSSLDSDIQADLSSQVHTVCLACRLGVGAQRIQSGPMLFLKSATSQLYPTRSLKLTWALRLALPHTSVSWSGANWTWIAQFHSCTFPPSLQAIDWPNHSKFYSSHSSPADKWCVIALDKESAKLTVTPIDFCLSHCSRCHVQMCFALRVLWSKQVSMR
jgi:hypothetical protein